MSAQIILKTIIPVSFQWIGVLAAFLVSQIVSAMILPTDKAITDSLTSIVRRKS